MPVTLCYRHLTFEMVVDELAETLVCAVDQPAYSILLPPAGCRHSGRLVHGVDLPLIFGRDGVILAVAH